jgi:DNA polymerase-3 subunit epsilon
MSKLFTGYRKKFFQGAVKNQDLPPSVLKHLSVTEHIRRDVDPREAVYVVFDTELTGLNPKKDSIVSIGALKVFGTRIDIGNPYYRVVEPRSLLTKQSVVIHGITPSEASVCPTIDMLMPEFLDFCGNGIVVGHFVSIDLTFLNKEMTRLFGLTLQNPSVDTCVLYQWLRKREENICAFHGGIKENVDLMTLAQKFSIPVFDAHNALNDAFITAQLLQRLIANLHSFNINTIEDLLRIGKPRKKE